MAKYLSTKTYGNGSRIVSAVSDNGVALIVIVQSTTRILNWYQTDF
jgi:hypothetical protein